MSYIGWRLVSDDNRHEWVQMRSGAGESAWWHRHEGEGDFGGNPVDDGKCRTCGEHMCKSSDSDGGATGDL